MSVEDRVLVAVKRVVVLKGLVVVFFEDHEFGDIYAALLKQAQEIRNYRRLAQFETIERRGFDSNKNHSFHI